MGRTKVFVGNLSFKTNDRDLAKEFEVAGKVASATIISRGSRSLGYGFVELESEEDAKKSVELLNKKLIDGREINVEIARPREDKPAPPAGGPADPNAPAAPAGGDAGRGRRPVRARRPRGRGGLRNQGDRTGPVNGAPGAAGGEGSPAAAGGSPAGGSPSSRPPRERRPRAPRARPETDRAPRTPSSDTLFVANLPFSVDDAGLAKIFEGLNIKSAHVVRKHNDRSKGFGFVEFHNAEDQQKALTAIDKKNVDSRELSVKVALTEVPRNNGASPAAAAPVNNTTTTTTTSTTESK